MSHSQPSAPGSPKRYASIRAVFRAGIQTKRYLDRSEDGPFASHTAPKKNAGMRAHSDSDRAGVSYCEQLFFTAAGQAVPPYLQHSITERQEEQRTVYVGRARVADVGSASANPLSARQVRSYCLRAIDAYVRSARSTRDRCDKGISKA